MRLALAEAVLSISMVMSSERQFASPMPYKSVNRFHGLINETFVGIYDASFTPMTIGSKCWSKVASGRLAHREDYW